IFGIEDLFPKFPPVLPSEENSAGIRPDVAEGLGLPADLAVVSGPMDVAACALGTGAIDHGQASTVLGTAGIHQVIMDRPILEPVMVGMTLCHGVKGRWMRMLAAMTATPNLDWFLEQMGAPLVAEAKGGDIYVHLEELIGEVPAGCEGVMYHPYLFPGGERGPFVKPSARASFTGLNLNHSLKHLLRAVYEGVALATLDCYRHMPVEPDSVLLSGGGAKSDAWCQIVSDCLGKPVSVPEGSQFGAKGAMINAGIAIGLYDDAHDAVKQTVRMARFFEPNAENTALYQELYEVYRLLAQRQMDLWDMRARILKEKT
ncbi:MAG: carbohydrate kinase, partial [Candidatus Brocadiae bacterium]|nr:carbohydrate kinase [Candidatus Brocadiia bacterium]